MKPVAVILVGQTPPPVHGQALAIQRLVQARFSRIAIHHVRMDFSSDIDEIGRVRLGKLWRLVRLIWRVLRLRFRTGARILYYPPAGPALVPVLRDIIFLATVRPFFSAVVFDFHAAGLWDMEARLPAPLKPMFRWAYHDANLAIHKYPPEWNQRMLPARRNVVVPYGIEDEYPAHAGGSQESTGLALLYVGIMTPGKGIWALLESVSALHARGVSVRAVCVGEFSSERTEMEWRDRVEHAGIGDYVRLTGQLDGEAKWREFLRADVFCFPTQYENEALPLAVIEAMQFGLPVVASVWRGIPFLVQDGVTGFLIAPGDSAALAGRLEQLANNESMRAGMGSKARKVYLDRFTVEAHLAGMEEALSSVAKTANDL